MKVTKAILLLLAVAKANETQENTESQTIEQPSGESNNSSGTENVTSESPDSTDSTQAETNETSGNETQSDGQTENTTDGSNGAPSAEDPIASDGTQEETGDSGSSETTGSENTETNTGSQEQTESQETNDSGTQGEEVNPTDGTQTSENTEVQDSKPKCDSECGSEEVCATLTSVVDLEGNTLPENHPNYGLKEDKCTAKTNCGTNFDDGNGNFYTADCPQEEETDAENTTDEQIPINAIDEINAENAENELTDEDQAALVAEGVAITLAQNTVRPGEHGGQCSLSGQKCNHDNLCCGVAVNSFGDKIEICGNGQGSAEPMLIGLTSYDHVCGSMKLMASLGSIAAALYLM